MKDMELTPDDPRLTAFALGELDGEEARAIAAAVAADPTLAAAVDEVRGLVGDLEGALASEPLPAVAPVSTSELKDEVYPFTPKKVLRFPVFWVSGLMAASFAVFMVVHNRNASSATHEQVVQYEINLTSLPSAAETAATSADQSTGGAVVLVAEVATAPASASSDADAPLVGRVAKETVSLPTMVVEITREQVEAAAVAETMRQAGLEPLASPEGAVQLTDFSADPAPLPGQLGLKSLKALDDVRFGEEPGALTFAVASTSYANVRRFLEVGQLPPAEVVDVKGMINAFPYDYPPPAAGAPEPIAAHLEVAAAPWAPEHRLVRVALKARDVTAAVHVEVEFNSQLVSAYQLVGYDTPAEMGAAPVESIGEVLNAGQSVTALYEVVPVAPMDWEDISRELLVVHVRAQLAEAATSAAWSFPLEDHQADFAAASEDFRFASAVAGLGLILRDSSERGLLSLVDVRRWAERAVGFDPGGHRQEFLGLIDRAQALLAR